MKRLIIGLAVASFCVASNARGAMLQTVDIGPYCNTRIQEYPLLGAADQFPEGPVVFEGIPFSRPEDGNNAWRGWYSIDGDMEGLRILEIDVDIYGAMEVFTLLNTFGGELLVGTFASVQFFGAEGGFFEKYLDGDSDIRDYLVGDDQYANNINNVSTINVFSAGSGRDEVRLDMQMIVLPEIFQTQTLDRIRLVDNGGTNPSVVKQRLLFSGVTVTAVPEPSSFVLLLIGVIALLMFNRRK